MRASLHDRVSNAGWEPAPHASMRDVGRALIITAAARVLGFLVFGFSALAAPASFGLFLASTIALALAADFFLHGGPGDDDQALWSGGRHIPLDHAARR